MRNASSTFYTIIKSAGILTLALILLAICYVSVLSFINWNGISV